MSEEQVINKLENYFEYVDSSLLEILDPDEANKDALIRGGYTGVTSGYLFKHVIPGCSEDLFLKVIDQLQNRKIVASIRCGDIGRRVFEKHKTDNDHMRWSRQIVDDSYISESLYYHNEEE